MTILREYDRKGEPTGRVKVTGTAAIPCGMWRRAKVRGVHKCALSGIMITPGEYAYTPDIPFHKDFRQYRVSESQMHWHADACEKIAGRRACPMRK